MEEDDTMVVLTEVLPVELDPMDDVEICVDVLEELELPGTESEPGLYFVLS